MDLNILESRNREAINKLLKSFKIEFKYELKGKYEDLISGNRFSKEIIVGGKSGVVLKKVKP